MFWHLYKNKIKILLGKKQLVFWTFLFPFILGLFFNVALSGVNDAYNLDPVSVAVIYDDKNDSIKENNESDFVEVIKELSKGDDRLLDSQFVDKEKAEVLLQDNDISGYVEFNKNHEPTLITNTSSGIEITVLKSIINQYISAKAIADTVIENDPQSVRSGILDDLASADYVQDASSEKLDFCVNYYFTLIAMACMYGGLMSLETVKDSEGNLSKKGARFCVSPVRKIKNLTAGLLATYSIQLVFLAALYLFIIFALGVDFGSKMPQIVILSLFGSLAGLILGAFIGVSNKKSDGFKTGLIIAVTMLLCFFSGMMGTVELKLFFERAIPLLKYISPVTIMSDGFYSLFAYDDFAIFINCIIKLGVISIVLLLLSALFMKRKKYDSI